MTTTKSLPIPRIPVETRPDGSLRAFCPHADRYFSCGRPEWLRSFDEIQEHLCFVEDCSLAKTGFRVELVETIPLPTKRRKPRYDRAGNCISRVLVYERRERARAEKLQ